MLIDYHTHTKYCKHADGEVKDYIEQGIKLGLKEIGCSEHIPMPDRFDFEHRMTDSEFVSMYKPAVFSAREKYRDKISIKWGIESEFFPGTEEYVKRFHEIHDFDYVIGSVHFLGEWGFDNPTDVWKYDERNVDDIYEEYFLAVADSAKSGLFDIVGHCDLVKKFGHRPAKNMKEVYRETMKEIKKAGMSIEINTSGLRKPVREIYPSNQILEIAKEMKIPIALGSDAHYPEDVGRDFDIACALLKEYGNGEVAVYSKRQRTMVKL